MAQLENELQPELQAAPSDPVGDDVAGKSITAVCIELSATKLIDTTHNIGGIVYVLDRYPQPMVVKQIEGVSLELYREPFCNFGVLIDTHVDRADRLTTFRVSAHPQERRTAKLCCVRIINDPVSLVQCDRHAGVNAHQPAVRSGWIRALTDGTERRTSIVQDWPASIKPATGKIGRVAQ